MLCDTFDWRNAEVDKRYSRFLVKSCVQGQDETIVRLISVGIVHILR